MDTLEEFEIRLEHVIGLSENGSYEESLDELEIVWKEFQARDEDRWIERAVLSQRGQILFELGKYAEAIQALRNAQELQPELLEYVSNQETLAEVLRDSGDAAAAIRELEAGLEKATGDAEAFALRLLIVYAGIADLQGTTVPLKHGSKLIHSAKQWDMEVPASALKDEPTFTRVLTGIGDRLRED